MGISNTRASGLVPSPPRLHQSDPGLAGTVGLCLLVVLALVPGGAGPVFAQDINRTVEFENYGFTRPLNVGARAAGMAGAYTAAGNDVYMLLYNPAGLAKIKRAELAFGLQQERNEISNVFYGTPNSIDTRGGGIDGLGAAFPLPTYRGSLVLAVGIFREYSGVFDLHYSGTNELTQTEDHYLVQQTGSTYSYNFGLGVDLSPELAGGVSLIIMDGTINTLSQYDFEFLNSTPRTSVFVKENLETDIDGVGGRIGVQIYFHPLIQGGITFTSPIWLNLKGNGIYELTKYQDNQVDSLKTRPTETNEDYMLPFRFNFGLSLHPGDFLIAAVVGFTDWTEASINRKRFRGGPNLETTFREVFDFRIGAEYTTPWIPARIRAGYARRPFPLEYLQADRIDNNALTKAETIKNPTDITFGLGGLIGNMLTVDAVYSYTESERQIAGLNEKRTSQRFALSAAYRF